MAVNRTNGKQVGDPAKFPSGMAALAKYVHGQGLKFVRRLSPLLWPSRGLTGLAALWQGLYSARCKTTCQKRAASWGYQTVDAQQYADWGVDYLSASTRPKHSSPLC